MLRTVLPRLLVGHSLLFDNGFAGDGATPGRLAQVFGTSFTSPCTARDYWSLIAADMAVVPVDPTTPGPDPGLPMKYGTDAPDAQTDLAQFIPDGSEPLVHTLATDCHGLDPFFDSTDYVGAFQPGAPSWLTAPWVSFELQ